MANKVVDLPEIFRATPAGMIGWNTGFEKVAAVNDWTTNATKHKWLKVCLISKAATILGHLPDETRMITEL